MNKEQQIAETQEKIENIFNKPTNFFYDTIVKYLSQDKDQLLSDLKNSNNSMKNNISLSQKEFITLGSLCYMVGIDYTNQPYLQENIAKKVNERFAQFDYSFEFINEFINCLKVVKESFLLEGKDSLRALVTKEVKVVTNSDKVESIHVIEHNMNLLRAEIVKLLNACTYRVGVSIDIDELKQKSKFTYFDYLKVQKILQEEVKIPGSKIKNFIKILQNPLFQIFIETGMDYFDKQKFAVVYIDSILSLKESEQKLPYNDLLNILAPTLYNEDGDCVIDFDIIKDCYDQRILENSKNSDTPVSDSSEYVPTYPKDEVNAFMSADPDKFIALCFQDIVMQNVLDIPKIMEAIEWIINDSDYSQHLYTYLKSVIKQSGRTYAKFVENYVIDIDIDKNWVYLNELISLLTEKEDSLKIEYKEVVEFTCKEIPKSIKSKIIDYINKTIESVVLENDEQKQFLVSQLMENSISTYNHIQQIVTLIETCNINGSDALNYVTLYKFLHENEEIVEAFEKSSSVATLGNTISIYQIFREWFTVNKEDGEQVAPEA